jgi:hypothetical protein
VNLGLVVRGLEIERSSLLKSQREEKAKSRLLQIQRRELAEMDINDKYA